MAILTFFIEFLKQLPNRVFKWKFLLKLFIFCPLICIALLFVFWIYLSTETISNLIAFEEAVKYSYDYIIVGGGTAGCILASRLTENPKTSVLLIEAGSTFSPLAMVPFLTSQQQRTQNDWKLTTVTQKQSSFGFWDQIQFLPRGKGLGGSSQLNYLLHFDGNKKDLDRWREHGVELWDIDGDEDLTYDKYTRNECSRDTCSIDEPNGSKVTHSSLFKTNLPATAISYDYSPLSSKFMEGVHELYRNNFSNLEYYLAKYNTHKGLRHSVYHTYLKPVLGRQNLRIVLSTRVHKVLFNKKTAIGVLAAEDYLAHSQQKVYAAREVILAAGAFHTPQILKLSGLGPSKELKKFEINVIHNSPMIGRNLYDHMSMPIYVSVDEKMTVTREKVLNIREVLNYLVRGSGIFSNFGVIGYVNDLEHNHGTGIFGVGAIEEKLLGKIVSYDREAFRANFPFHNDSKQEGFVLLNTCLQPLSRGTVRLSSNRIQDAPEIDPNYLDDQADVDCLIRAIRLSIKLMSTEAFKAAKAKIHWPKFNQCKNLISFDDDDDDVNITDQYLECIIRVGGITAHHPGGSCAIGKAPNNALDGRMRVRGVRKIRVIDASVIPTPVSGHPHAAIAAFAELASQMILYENIPK